MRRIVRLTERDLTRLVRRVIKEQNTTKFVLKPGMVGKGILQDEAEGKIYTVVSVTDLKCDITEVKFKMGNFTVYGYFRPSKELNSSESKKINFTRLGEGVKSNNACNEFDEFNNLGLLQFSGD